MRLIAGLLIPVTFAVCAAVTRIEFNRSGGQVPGRIVKGTVQLRGSTGRVTAANGYARDLGSAEVSQLRKACGERTPPPAVAPDAYTYSVRIERGKKSRAMNLSDASPHPLVPWLQKETAAISRFSSAPATR